MAVPAFTSGHATLAAAPPPAHKAELSPKERTRRVLRLLLVVLGLLLGTSLIAYPYVSDYVHKKAASQIVVSQSSTVSKINKQQLSEEMRKALDYNARLAKGRAHVTDPFNDKSNSIDDREYKSLLNLNGDGVMATLIVPKMQLKLPIYHTTQDSVLSKGVGHMSSTSLPVGGANSHAALAGHNGLPSMKIFDELNQLKVGDEFGIDVLGEEHVYRVTGTEVTLPNETQSLLIQPGKDLVTLITCTPYGVNTHRLLVHAERISGWTGDNGKVAKTVTGAPTAKDSLITLTLIGVAIALGVLFAVLLGVLQRAWSRRRKAQSVAG